MTTMREELHLHVDIYEALLISLVNWLAVFAVGWGTNQEVLICLTS